MTTVNGWTIRFHPLLIEQLERLSLAVEREKVKDPEGYGQNANARLLNAVHHLIFERIPSDPSAAEYRQGGTLGSTRKHWFRAKFGNQRFQLFFRYSSTSRIIIFAWVNDASTLRTYGSRTDAYAVFRSMLDKGNPPDDWNSLLEQTRPPKGNR